MFGSQIAWPALKSCPSRCVSCASAASCHLVVASCLPDLVQGDEHYAVGLWFNNWPAGEVAVELVRIINSGPGCLASCSTF